MPTFIDDTNEQEERTSRKTVIEHLKDRTLCSLQVEGEQPKDNEPHVTD